MWANSRSVFEPNPHPIIARWAQIIPKLDQSLKKGIEENIENKNCHCIWADYDDVNEKEEKEEEEEEEEADAEKEEEE